MCSHPETHERTSRLNANTRQLETVCDVCGAVITLDCEEVTQWQ